MSTIYIPSLNAFHLHLPKTGGTTVKRALQAANIKFVYVAHMLHKPTPLHLDWKRTLDSLPSKYSKASFFSFVRHPANWYASRYGVNVSKKWGNGIRAQEADYKSESFDEFVTKCCTKRPGFYSEIVDRYCGTELHPIDFIGKTETVIQDLINILEALGQQNIPRKKLHNLPRFKVGHHKKPLLPHHYELIHTSELRTYNRFLFPLKPQK